MTPCFPRRRSGGPAGPGRHQLRGSRAPRTRAYRSRRQRDEGLRLPSQQPRVDVGLVPVRGDVTQVRQVRPLWVDDRLEVRAAAADHVLVHGEVRVPLGREALEQAATRREQRARAPALFDEDAPRLASGSVTRARRRRPDPVTITVRPARLGAGTESSSPLRAGTVAGPRRANRGRRRYCVRHLGRVDRRDPVASRTDRRDDLVELGKGPLTGMW